MGKEKIIIIGSVLLILLFLFLGTKKIKSLRMNIKEQVENVEKSNQRLEKLRYLEESLELRRETGKVLCQIPQADDPMANKVLTQKFIQSYLSRLGLDAEVKVDNERQSKDFPDVVDINEVPLKIGIKSYSSYDQVMNLLREFKNFPFVIEVLTIGGTDVAVPGILRIQLKYYAVQEST